MNFSQNIELFKELLNCGDNVSVWKFDANGHLLYTNSTQEALFLTTFSVLGCKDKMLLHAKNSRNPILLGSAIGITWGAAFEYEGENLNYIHVIGPVLFVDVSMRQIEQGFSAYNHLEISIAWKSNLIAALRNLSVLSNIIFSRYLLMLNYCVTGQHLQASDLTLLEDAPLKNEAEFQPEPNRDRHKVWSAEQAMLQMVRNGDLNYKDALSNSILISNGVPVHGRDPLRQSKSSVLVFCSIVCRAAIEGGLSPEEAFSVGDFYIQNAENAQTLDELLTIPHAMYDNFIRRVHKCRTNPTLSRPIQQCIDYIEMHLNQRIRAADLAALVGYSEYYLTHKFHEETNCFISDYIKFAKIERAKVLLASSENTLNEIAEELGFTTRSYFSQCFKQVVGVSPAEYRQK